MARKGPILAAIGLLCSALSPASAAYIPVFGSPEYAPATGGYKAASQPGFSRLVGQGVAGGRVGKFTAAGTNVGSRPVRFTPAGAVELGTLATSPAGVADATLYAVGPSGTAVGFDTVAGRPVRWDAGSTLPTELGNLGVDESGKAVGQPYAVNARGTIVGYMAKPNPERSGGMLPVRWDAGGTAVTELGVLGIPRQGRIVQGVAQAVNANGTAVGYVSRFDQNGLARGVGAARWDAGGTACTELLGLPPSPGDRYYAQANAISAAGVVVGFGLEYDADGLSRGQRPLRWAAGGVASTPLGTLGSFADGSISLAVAVRVNDAGTAVGTVTRYDADHAEKGPRAVRWTIDGTAAAELPSPWVTADGTASTSATDINAAGDVVGNAVVYDAAGTRLGVHAVYWPAGSVAAAVDLNSLIDPAGGWTLTSASGITDGGWVTGLGTYDPDGPGGQAGYARLYLVQVPEPSAGLAVVAAIGALMGRRRGTSGRR